MVGHRRIDFSKPKRKQFLRTRILEAPEPRLKNPPAAEEPKKNKKIIVEDEIDVKYKSFKKFDTVKEHSDNYFSIPEHLDGVSSCREIKDRRCIRTTPEELEDFSTPDVTIYNVGQFPCNRYTHYMTTSTSIDLNLDRKEMVILGTQYAGEMKKGLFGVMHYLMPKRNILSLNSSNNMGKDGDVALFFGLSGTGKATLSTDHNRLLIGDDEHCWSENGISNIEGGCYAKCIGLTKEKEPDIWNAIKFGTGKCPIKLNMHFELELFIFFCPNVCKFLAVLENIIFDEHTREVDYSDNSITVHCIKHIVMPAHRYYHNITSNTLVILEAMAAHGVKTLIYSSTCATYGEPEKMPITEVTPQHPINPYGKAKKMAEDIILDFSKRSDMAVMILRYFNVIGSDPEGRLGEAPRPELREHGRISGACFDATLGIIPGRAIREA
ncbi:hypothetical protein ZIOFF_021513 [Zingiber officinale]|uniref:phosphoenolpyruvate carboxykinase (ATP) n=1 Tax=Zingiber officinale TaxID=94328 RepID=A0A8J5H0D9_ZINOF|nr:hypothetical protein ZIOFF_021513 [Zingiber officinale]